MFGIGMLAAGWPNRVLAPGAARRKAAVLLASGP